MLKPSAVVWKGDPTQQGLKVLGIPICQLSYIREFYEEQKTRTDSAVREDSTV